MKKYLPVLFILLLAAQSVFSQSENTDFLVQSPDGKTVKLVWFLKSGNPAITGFDIKRKEGLESWVKLNAEPILPAISAKKILKTVESDNAELGRIKDKLADMMKKGKLREIDNVTYLQKLNNGDKEIQDISEMIAIDYDLALICGFGYVDHTVVQKTNYEYGLFIKGTDILLDKVSWNYGEIPDLNVVREITSRSTPGKNGIQIMWNADLDKMKAGYVVGFNIYRQGLRLNEHPIVAANNKEPDEFLWYDKSASGSAPSQYSISAESLFGIEGIIKPYTYNPDEHAAIYKKPEVTQITSIGYYFKEGISIQWSFPKDQEHFLKGFYVEKDNMPGGYHEVSRLLQPSDRVFIDKTSSPVSGYIRFRVTAVFNDKMSVPGVEKLYHYFPMREPPRPLDTKIKGVAGDKKFDIKLSWAPRMNGDSLTDNYMVYMFDVVNGKFIQVPDKQLIRNNSYNYIVQHGSAATYQFYVTALSKAKTESLSGDTVSVQVPSFDLPTPVISRAAIDGNKALIQWQYPEIQDLKGFRLFQNDTLIANETMLKKNIREFTTADLVQNVNYNYVIRAISEGEVISEPSKAAPVLIVPVVKKATDYR